MGLYDFVVAYIGEGKKGVLATVIRRTGSAPRDVGAKMFIGEDGKTFGTVGGGRLEADAYDKALGIMNKDVVEVFSINMGAQKIEEKDMLCGGNVDVLLEPISPTHSNVYNKILECQKNRTRGIIITEFTKIPFLKAIIDEDSNVIGDTLENKIIDQYNSYLHDKQASLIGDVLIEPVHISYPLYIFGAGHVASFLSKIAKIGNFNITVIDDREEFANSERFPDADTIIIGNFHDTLKCLDFTGNEYVVILTRSHEQDAEVLEECLKRPTRYTGMIGSRRKVKIILDHLVEKGFGSDVVNKVHAPIGIAISAETPEEIAISIVAQLISVRNEKIRKV